MLDPTGETADRWLDLFDAVEGSEGEAEVGRLTFVGRLDDGDNAESFLAHDRELGTNVVVHAAKSDDVVDNSRFLAEARALQGINSRHVRQVVSIGIGSDKRPYAVMEHLDRGSLRRRLDSGIEPGRADVDRLVDFLADAMQTLRESQMAEYHVGVDDVMLQSALPASFPPGRLFADDERLLLGEQIARQPAKGSLPTDNPNLRVDRPPFRQVEMPFDLRGASAIVGEMVCGSAPGPDMSWLVHLRTSSRFPELNTAILNGLSDVGEQPESIEAWRQQFLSDRFLAADDRRAGLGAWFVDLRRQTKPAHYVLAGAMAAIMTGVLLAGTVERDEGSTVVADDEAASPETSNEPETSDSPSSGLASSTAPASNPESSVATTSPSSSTSRLNARATLPGRSTLPRTTSTRPSTTSAASGSSSAVASSTGPNSTGANSTGSSASGDSSSSTGSSAQPTSTNSSTTTTTGSTTTIASTTTTTPSSTGTSSSTGPATLTVTGVGVESVGTNNATLTWDALDGVVGYEVRVNGPDNPVDNRDADDTSVELTGLATGRNAMIEIRAVGDSGERGAWVAVLAELTGTDSFGPDVESNPAPSATATSTEITVAWANIDGNVGYDVYLGTNWRAGPAPNVTNHTFTGLEPGTNYLIEVQTKTGTGGQDRSERVPLVVTTES